MCINFSKYNNMFYTFLSKPKAIGIGHRPLFQQPSGVNMLRNVVFLGIPNRLRSIRQSKSTPPLEPQRTSCCPRDRSATSSRKHFTPRRDRQSFSTWNAHDSGNMRKKKDTSSSNHGSGALRHPRSGKWLCKGA